MKIKTVYFSFQSSEQKNADVSLQKIEVLLYMFDLKIKRVLLYRL